MPRHCDTSRFGRPTASSFINQENISLDFQENISLDFESETDCFAFSGSEFSGLAPVNLLYLSLFKP